MSDILRDIIARNRAGEAVAIPSVCSAHPDVLAAAMALAAELDLPLVVEATSNQVNQDGGYTGQRPADFIAFARGLAAAEGLDASRLVLGGDHLGPQVWRRGPAEAAMAQARQLVADYAAAGFAKIHLDCSEGCAGEPAQLPDAVTATRAADLAACALRAAPDPDALVFVIGTEVPPPGGARADEHGAIVPTAPGAARATLAAHDAAFAAAGIGAALSQVGGLVVQPGVEFSPMEVHRLPAGADPGLRPVMMDRAGLCLEAHSTDYQHPEVFVRLAQMGFAFQKVGPALTHAYRRAVYALDMLSALAGWGGGGLAATMEALMLADPRHWQGHCRGDSGDIRVERHFGLADRIRYYWPQPSAQAAVAALMADLAGRRLPLPLLEQGFAAPVLARALSLGGPLPAALVRAEIQLALLPYFLDSAGRRPKETAA